MDVTADLDAPCPPDELFAWVDDLGRYPRWLDIVPRASAAEPHPDDPGPAWSVDLRGRLGPFARSKRLRMARTVHEPRRVRFERVEHDGRQHSPWVLSAEVTGIAGGSRLRMHLHYGGSLVGPLVERLLADEIARSRPRLLALLAEDGVAG
ncbi:MAG TPA: SRPBCC family protein [Acidimicrobiales bacterium]|nr:SRPBCC family protein [Acidimicrobiales bacterium]